MKVIVVGAGTMGLGIAHVFACSGFQVLLVDQSDEQLSKASSTIKANLDRQVTKGALLCDAADLAIGRISFSKTLKDFSDAVIAIEAVFEDLNAKQVVLQQLDMFVSETTVIATNTSSISVTQLASSVTDPTRFIGMHFMNPVPIMSLVEIIKGFATSDETLNMVVAISKQLNKEPLVVNDYPGFVANRILMPMINEAIWTLHEGVADVTTIDKIMKLGMAHPMGPLQLADYIGLDVCLNILKVMHSGFGNPKYAPCPLLVNMVLGKQLGAKTGEGFYVWAKGGKELSVSLKFKQLYFS